MLLVIESTDVIFAVDSVPAIFGITRDPFIVFTSNIFAILGLRALYFLLAGMVHLFRYLRYGLAAVLVFVGLKMIAEFWTELHFFKDYPWASLVVIVVLLGISIIASLLAPRKQRLHKLDNQLPITSSYIPTFHLLMNHFLHKHRYWFLALILASVVALIYFQMRDDGGTVPPPPVPTSRTARCRRPPRRLRPSHPHAAS